MKTIFRIFWFISVIFFCIFAYRAWDNSDYIVDMWVSLGFMWFFWIFQFFVKDFDYTKKDKISPSNISPIQKAKKENDRYKKTEDKYFK